jgi:hypothetical protein
MIPKTEAHTPPEFEQEMTIEPPAKRFFGALVIGVAIVLASHLAGFPRLTKPETGQPLAQKAEVMPDQLQDLSAVAEYQFRLSGGDFGQVDSSEFTGVEELPDQIPDRQALADYQWLVGSGNFNALAEYQRPLGGSDFSRLGGRMLADVVELPDQIPDRQALADYQSRLGDLLSSRPMEELKIDKLSK